VVHDVTLLAPWNSETGLSRRYMCTREAVNCCLLYWVN